MVMSVNNLDITSAKVRNQQPAKNSHFSVGDHHLIPVEAHHRTRWKSTTFCKCHPVAPRQELSWVLSFVLMHWS